MKTGLLIFVALFGCVGLSGQADNSTSSAMRKIEFVVATQTPVLSKGGPVMISFSVTNKTGGKITIWRSTFFENHRLVIKRADGREITMTEKGLSLSRLFAPSGERSKNYCIKLAPGQSDRSMTPVDLSEIYSFEVGLYYLNVYYEDAQCVGFSGGLFSNELVFEIK